MLSLEITLEEPAFFPHLEVTSGDTKKSSPRRNSSARWPRRFPRSSWWLEVPGCLSLVYTDLPLMPFFANCVQPDPGVSLKSPRIKSGTSASDSTGQTCLGRIMMTICHWLNEFAMVKAPPSRDTFGYGPYYGPKWMRKRKKQSFMPFGTENDQTLCRPHGLLFAAAPFGQTLIQTVGPRDRLLRIRSKFRLLHLPVRVKEEPLEPQRVRCRWS